MPDQTVYLEIIDGPADGHVRSFHGDQILIMGLKQPLAVRPGGSRPEPASPGLWDAHVLRKEKSLTPRAPGSGVFMIVDDYASERHGEVVKQQGGWFVRDEGSLNGILLRGMRLKKGGEPQRVEPKEAFLAGRTVIAFGEGDRTMPARKFSRDLLSPSSVAVARLAIDMAGGERLKYWGVRHLFAAACLWRDEMVAKFIAELGSSQEDASEAMMAFRRWGGSTHWINNHYAQLTRLDQEPGATRLKWGDQPPRVARVMEASMEVAARLHSPQIEPIHMILGALRDEWSPAVGWIHQMGFAPRKALTLGLEIASGKKRKAAEAAAATEAPPSPAPLPPPVPAAVPTSAPVQAARGDAQPQLVAFARSIERMLQDALHHCLDPAGDSSVPLYSELGIWTDIDRLVKQIESGDPEAKPKLDAYFQFLDRLGRKIFDNLVDGFVAQLKTHHHQLNPDNIRALAGQDPSSWASLATNKARQWDAFERKWGEKDSAELADEARKRVELSIREWIRSDAGRK